MNVTAEDFEARARVLLQERRSGEADEHRIWHDRFHRAMKFPALRAMAFIYKHKDFANRHAWLGLEVFDKGVEIVHLPAAELVNQRAKEARFALTKQLHQVAAAARARDGLAGASEDALDLFVEFVAISDDRHASVCVVLENPLGQEHHDDALAAALAYAR